MESGNQLKISGLITTVSNMVLKEKLGADLAKESVGKAEIIEKTKPATRYLIRRGRVQDCTQISVLMKELAESEAYGDRVEVTAEDLRRDGFGDHPVFETIVLEDTDANMDSAILGYILYYMGFCSWKGRLLYMEDVFVKAEIRGTGLGLALLHTIAQISEERGCKVIQGTAVEWNKEVMKLYKRIGAKDMTETEKYHLVAIGKSEIQRFAKAKIPVLHNGSQVVTCELW